VTLLAKVVDSFDIASRLCVVLFRFQAEDGRIRVKDRIQLRTPRGQIKDTYVTGIEHVKHNILYPIDRSIIGISAAAVWKKDAPPGTEIWLLPSSGEES